MEAKEQADAIVRLSGVHQHYRNGKTTVQALHDISLHIAPGDMLAVCGPSGHGKTTLMNLVGLLASPSAGSIAFGGAPVEHLPESARARIRSASIGLIFQHTNLIPALTAQENVMLAMRASRSRRQAERELADELLARLGLATQQRRRPDQLDASQRQRVAIARALATGPALVVADEPTSRLDSGSVRMVLDLFCACQREHGTAFVIATRDQRQLLRAARTLQLSEGRLLGAPADTPRFPQRAYA